MAKTWISADFRRALEARDRWFSDLAIYSFHSYPPFSISACCRGYWRLFEASISLHFSSMFMNKSQTFASARISFSIWLHESHIIFMAFTVREIAVWWWQGGTELQFRDERRVEKAELYLGFEMPKNWSFRWCWNYGCQIEMCPIEDPSSLWPGPLTSIPPAALAIYWRKELPTILSDWQQLLRGTLDPKWEFSTPHL